MHTCLTRLQVVYTCRQKLLCMAVLMSMQTSMYDFLCICRHSHRQMHELPVGPSHKGNVIGSRAIAPVMTAFLQILTVSAHYVNEVSEAYSA